MVISKDSIAIELYPSWYYAAWLIYAVLFGVSIFLSLLFPDVLGGLHPFGADIWNTRLLSVFIALFGIASIRFPKADLNIAISVLNRPSKEGLKSPVFSMPGIMQFLTFPRGFNQDEFPAPPEMIAKESAFPTLPAGMFRPMFITTAGFKKGDEDDGDPLSQRLTIEPTATVQWQVEATNDGFFEFYVNIPGESWEEKNNFLVQIMRDTVERVLRVEISKYTPRELYTSDVQESLVVETRKKLCEAVDKWGVAILEVNVLGTQPDHATNIALGLIPRAIAEARSTGITADAERNRLIQVGIGVASAKAAEIAAAGDGLKKAADSLGMSPEEYARLQAVKEIVGDKTIFLGVDGIKEALLAAAKGFGKGTS